MAIQFTSTKIRAWRRGLECLALLLISTLSAIAANPIPTGDTLPRDSKPHEGVLLLRSGRVIKGKIFRGGDEYRVQRSRGEMFVPEDAVHFACRDMKDAYQKQKAELPKLSAAERVILARWCISYNLLEEAQQELRDALILEPSRIQSRRMLKKLDDVLGHTANPSDKISTSRTRGSNPNQTTAVQEVESLGGLSPEDAKQFVRRIQPLLMNNCGNARCHGSASENDFQITPVKFGRVASRHAAERNLAATLKFIDFDKPYQSQLLAVPKGNHGGGKSPFQGRAGRTQLRKLREWVLRVTEEKTNRRLATRIVDRRVRDKIRTRNPTTTISTGDRSKKTQPPVEKPVGGKKTDAFNPNDFNTLGRR